MFQTEAVKNIKEEINMELMEAMKNRHSVRSYNDRKIDGTVKDK